MNGLSPLHIDAMSLGQWVAIARGWAAAHQDPNQSTPPTDEEFEAAVIAARSMF